MDKQPLSIDYIPAILWGPESDKLFIAVHGDQSNKADKAVMILAEEAAKKGYRTLSFDLPEHGDRKEVSWLCNPQNCTHDLKKVMQFARTISGPISLFGYSMGAYFSMLAYGDDQIRQALFLSPVVDMKRIIQNMMTWFNISEEQLKREQEISTPVKTLYWDYYQYVLKYPVMWNKPTALLYGGKDDLCEFDYVSSFAKNSHAGMTVLKDGEHHFHTDSQLAFLRQWLHNKILL